MIQRHQVIICGAGIAGVSAAYYLRQAGIRDILLLDERPPLTLTSDVSSEGYRNWWPDPQLRALMDRSIDLMEDLAGASGNVIRMNRRGYLYLSADRDKVTALQAQAASIAESGAGPLRVHSSIASDYAAAHPEGYRHEPRGADLLLGEMLIQHHFPDVSQRSVAALHVRRAGWLSAQQLGMHLLEAAREQGVKFKSARLDGIETLGGRVNGVSLDGGERIECEIFVNAAGPYLKAVGALAGLDLPVESQVHLKVAFEDSRRIVAREAPMLIWSDAQFLPWEEEERLLLESDAESSWLTGRFPSGAHTRPEGAAEGATILMLWDYRTRVMEPVFPVPLDDQYPEIVLRGLSTMLPGLAAYVGRGARPRLDGGYYVRTRENRPLIGPTPAEGVYLIGALSGLGIMSACAAGELLAATVSGAQLPDYAPAFSLGRYQDPAYVEALNQWNETGEL